ncbi:MAG: CoA transferase subunit A [Anaerolineales bacterium]|nr:MAG: CoA transferase subunit A [Anaerolineales bacterium]
MSKTGNNKLVSLTEAAAMVKPKGCQLSLGGFTLYRRPMAFSLALLDRFRNENTPSDITLLNFTSSVESDILVGEGMVSKIRTCYFGLEVFGLAPHFTSAAANGSIQIIEETEASLAFGIRAAMAGVGFMPSIAWQGTDLLRLRPDVKTIEDPYSGEVLTAFPAINCDVAVIHALEADPDGNACIGANQGVDRELSLIADKVIITAEKVVPRLEKVDIVGIVVDAVVEIPDGAWPTSCHPLYALDGLAILDYVEQVGCESYNPLLDTWLARHKLA